MKDCPELNKLVTKYKAKQTSLEDQADTYVTAMRSGKEPKIKQARLARFCACYTLLYHIAHVNYAPFELLAISV